MSTIWTAALSFALILIMLLRYSGDQLKALRPGIKTSIALHLYHTLKDHNICGVQPTHRGKRAGSRPSKQTNMREKSRSRKLKMQLLNIRSVSNKSSLLSEHIISKALDMLILTETWLSDSDGPTINTLCPEGFSFMGEARNSTRKTRGGGVGIIYSDRLCAHISRVTIPNYTTFEAMAFRIKSKTSRRFAVIYRPPSSPIPLFLEEVESLLSELVNNCDEICIVGDFNIHAHSHISQFTSILTSADLVQHITVPTHKYGHTLDFLITRDNDPNLKLCNVINYNFSDHYSVDFAVTLCASKQKQKMKVRKLRKINPDAFAEALEEAVSSHENATVDVDLLCNSYNEVVTQVMDSQAPLIEITPKQGKRKSWYNDSIHEARKMRRRLERKYKKTGLTVHLEMLRAQQGEVVRLIDQAKTIYFRNRLDNTDMHTTFKTVKSILHPQVKSLPAGDSNMDISNTFVKYFRDKVEEIRDALSSAGTDDGRDLPTCPQAQVLLESFPTITVTEVAILVKQCPTKSCALDPMPTWLLKSDKVLQVVAPMLAETINASLRSGIFPSCFKKAVVTPVLKKANLDTNTLKNYRPVSNLTFVGKLMERIAAKHIIEHMSKNELFDTYQSAYRKGHSVETTLLHVKDYIDRALDEGDGVLLLLTDLSAAFDTVDHKILLDRLSSIIGVRSTALSWISSYLENRSQCVAVGGVESEEVALTTGVPQGSVLGPLLFLCYVRPLACVIQAHSLPRHGYADDNQVYTRFKLGDPESLQRAISVLESCVSDIRVWMARNKLKLNDNKTELLLVTPKYHMSRHLTNNPSVTVGNVSILPSTCVRNLGAMFDRHMNMTSQVDHVVKSMYLHIRLLSKIRHILDTETCKTVVNALVLSRLDFNNALLMEIPITLLNRLQRAQNAAARIVSGTRKYEHISPVLRSLHWLPVKERIKYKALLLVYKVVNDLCPPQYLTDILTYKTPARTTRSSFNTAQLSVKWPNKTVGERAFQCAGPRLWNKLTESVRRSPSLETFKSNLKTFLFST